MKWSQLFTSSVGKKLTMSLTGLFLIAFLVVHVGINACIWANDNGEMFNRAAHFMGTTVVVRIMEVGLFLFLILHIVQGYLLEVKNLSRRGQGYAMSPGNKTSKWYSRTMGLLGTLLALFLIMHINHFWIGSRFGGMWSVQAIAEVDYDGKPYHNQFAQMVDVFKDPFIVILYVLGCISLAYHLIHGFQSAFRTLGVYNNRYLVMLRSLGIGFSLIVCLAFAMMPVSMYLGWVR
ncbi:MAG: succinate dehydrogenase cytochrome b subunit [Chitinophagaceae bacterium]